MHISSRLYRASLHPLDRNSIAALNSLVARSGQRGTQLLITVINDLYEHAEEDFALIIDDYHLVDREEEISFFVSQFVQYAPNTCHVVAFIAYFD